MPSVVGTLNMKRIMDIACGSHHSLALTEDGEVPRRQQQHFFLDIMIEIIIIIKFRYMPGARIIAVK